MDSGIDEGHDNGQASELMEIEVPYIDFDDFINTIANSDQRIDVVDPSVQFGDSIMQS